MERLEKALRTAAAGRDKSAKSAKEALEKIRFPATQKPESVAEPEGGLGAVAAAAKKLYAVLERLKSA
jgi:hypothetical protein